MAQPCLLGYARAFHRGPKLDEQFAALKRAGVVERFIYQDDLASRRQDGRSMFGEVLRALRGSDILAVPSLAVFARNRAEVIAGMQGLQLRSVGLVSVDEAIDTREPDPDQLFKLAQGLQRAEYIWKRERTATAGAAASASGRTGRRPRLGPKAEAAARALWLDPTTDKTNDELATEIGLSKQRLWAKFGPRPPKE
jgi:DNA invertase Pin-like site-specific DNA recombinase